MISSYSPFISLGSLYSRVYYKPNIWSVKGFLKKGITLNKTLKVKLWDVEFVFPLFKTNVNRNSPICLHLLGNAIISVFDLISKNSDARCSSFVIFIVYDLPFGSNEGILMICSTLKFNSITAGGVPLNTGARVTNIE